MEKNRTILAIEQLIEFKFPKIKNLNVVETQDFCVSITFDEGKYTKTEVESAMENCRKDIREGLINEFKHLTSNFTVIPQSFGFEVKNETKE